MGTQAPKRRRRLSAGRRARMALSIGVPVLIAGAVGLYVQPVSTLSVHIPAGWRVLTEQTDEPGVHGGEITLAGPKRADFFIEWTSQPEGDACVTDPCYAASPAPLDTTVLGEPVTLAAPLYGGDGALDLPIEGHDLAGRHWYIGGECHPVSPSLESVCGDIASSISFSTPIFADLRSDTVVVALS